jgi:serine/threonine protein phosphatase PrpC
MSGAMADAIIKQAAIERSMDNLTIVIVSFDNLQAFLNDRPKPTKLENHLF